jgi:hypothetical protein
VRYFSETLASIQSVISALNAEGSLSRMCPVFKPPQGGLNAGQCLTSFFFQDAISCVESNHLLNSVVFPAQRGLPTSSEETLTVQTPPHQGRNMIPCIVEWQRRQCRMIVSLLNQTGTGRLSSCVRKCHPAHPEQDPMSVHLHIICDCTRLADRFPWCTFRTEIK